MLLSTTCRARVSDLLRLCHGPSPHFRAQRVARSWCTSKQPISRPSAVRAELTRILKSPHFSASERNRRFLAYVVEKALARQTDRIKAYTIATKCSVAAPAFDPQLDPVVRIEAGRLRRSLEHYYLTDGRTSHLRIEIPRGGYVPIFGCAEPVQSPHSSAGPPRVLVTTFEEEGDQSSFPTFTRGFTRSLIIALTRFNGLRVFGAEGALRHPNEIDPRAARRELAPDYLVTGQTSLFPDRFLVEVLLVEAQSGHAEWADTFERSLQPSQIIALRNGVANLVAQAMATILADLGQRTAMSTRWDKAVPLLDESTPPNLRSPAATGPVSSFTTSRTAATPKRSPMRVGSIRRRSSITTSSSPPPSSAFATKRPMPCQRSAPSTPTKSPTPKRPGGGGALCSSRYVAGTRRRVSRPWSGNSLAKFGGRAPRHALAWGRSGEEFSWHSSWGWRARTPTGFQPRGGGLDASRVSIAPRRWRRGRGRPRCVRR